MLDEVEAELRTAAAACPLDGGLDEKSAEVAAARGRVDDQLLELRVLACVADGEVVGDGRDAELCPCAHPDGLDRWKNHGAYVRCVAHASNDFLAAGLITETEKDAIQSAAGESSCGHKNK